MKYMYLIIGITLLASCSSVNRTSNRIPAQSTPTYQDRVLDLESYFRESGKDIRVSTNYTHFLGQLIQGDVRTHMLQGVGYSGVDYADKTMIDSDFRNLVGETRFNTEANVRLAVTLGASVDGFGQVGYDAMADMQKNGELANTRVAGMVAAQVTDYLKYNSISLNQNFVYLHDTKGIDTWALYEGANNVSKTAELVNTANSTLFAFEGGQQAYTEILEHALNEPGNKGDLAKNKTLKLVVGYEGLNVKNAASGFKAASLAALTLRNFPELIRADLKIEIYVAGKTSGKAYSLGSFFRSKHGKKLIKQYRKATYSEVDLDKFKKEFSELKDSGQKDKALELQRNTMKALQQNAWIKGVDSFIHVIERRSNLLKNFLNLPINLQADQKAFYEKSIAKLTDAKNYLYNGPRKPLLLQRTKKIMPGLGERAGSDSKVRRSLKTAPTKGVKVRPVKSR